MKLLPLTRVFQLASIAGLCAALFFLWRGQWDGVFVAAALGGVAWFARVRAELSALLPPDEDFTEENNEN